MAASPDRYEPLPGLFGLPGHFLRKLSPTGRRIAVALGVLALAGAVAATIVLAPRIAESKREHAAAERAARERAAMRDHARLIAEQRPRRGRVTDGAAAITSVERAITRDARARVATGGLENPARRTDCRSLGREGGRLLLGCTAITSEVESTERYTGVVVGYTFRAALSPDSGRYAFCKTSGRPAVGFSGRQLPPVTLPRACGG